MKEEMILNVKELKEETKGNLFGAYCDCVCDYDSGYICDIIAEIADSHIDIYYSDLFDWAKGNTSWIEEANEELGTPTDIVKQIQQGQYIAYTQELYDNFNDMILLFIYDYLYNTLNVEEITEEQNDEITTKEFDNNDKLEDVISFVNEVLESEEGSNEE